MSLNAVQIQNLDDLRHYVHALLCQQNGSDGQRLHKTQLSRAPRLLAEAA